MPIMIYKLTTKDKPHEKIALLCDDEWLHTPQVDAFSQWLKNNVASESTGEYITDIGFSWRRVASASGPVLDVAAMRRMVDLGMQLFLSEYPGFAGEDETIRP